MATAYHGCLQLPPLFLLPRASFGFASKRGIKSISTPRQTRFTRGEGLPELETSIAAALKRKAYTTPLRTGALGTKKGMSAIYDTETGRRRACTIIQMDRVQVVAHKTRQMNGYYAVQIGCGWKHPSNVTRPLLGHYAGQGVSPKRHLVEFRVRDERGLANIGDIIGPGWFQEGQYVDAKATSRGMGFEGGMKRHGFKGQGASHGNSLNHRTMGSSGQSQGGGSRVLPGKKMPGRMGGHQVTTQNVKVMRVDEEKGIVVLNGSLPKFLLLLILLTGLVGCIPGPDGCLVKLSDAIKKPWPEIPMMASAAHGVAEPLREPV